MRTPALAFTLVPLVVGIALFVYGVVVASVAAAIIGAATAVVGGALTARRRHR